MCLHALLLRINGRLENGTRLHLRDLGVGDAEPAATMSKHRVELVQLFDPAQQGRQDLLEIGTSFCTEVSISFHQQFLLLRASVGEDGDVLYQFLALGNKFMQWWIK